MRNPQLTPAAASTCALLLVARLSTTLIRMQRHLRVYARRREEISLSWKFYCPGARFETHDRQVFASLQSREIGRQIPTFVRWSLISPVRLPTQARKTRPSHVWPYI